MPIVAHKRGSEKAQSEINWFEDADIILNNPNLEKSNAFGWIQEGMKSVY